jgi:hypothetical protein
MFKRLKSFQQLKVSYGVTNGKEHGGHVKGRT